MQYLEIIMSYIYLRLNHKQFREKIIHANNSQIWQRENNDKKV